MVAIWTWSSEDRRLANDLQEDNDMRTKILANTGQIDDGLDVELGEDRGVANT